MNTEIITYRQGHNIIASALIDGVAHFETLPTYITTPSAARNYLHRRCEAEGVDAATVTVLHTNR